MKVVNRWAWVGIVLLVGCRGEEPRAATGAVEAPSGSETTAEAALTGAGGDQPGAGFGRPVAEGTGESDAALRAMEERLAGTWAGRFSQRRARTEAGLPVQIVAATDGTQTWTWDGSTLQARWVVEAIDEVPGERERVLDVRVAVTWTGGPSPGCDAETPGVYVMRYNTERGSMLVAEQLAEPCAVRSDLWFGMQLQALR